MKSKLIILKIITLLVANSFAINAQTDTTENQTVFTCPMACSDFSSLEPARCPVCGMDLKPSITKQDKPDYKVIKPNEVIQLMESDENFLMLDVRTESEFNGDLKPLDNAVLIPISELEDRIDELDEFKDQKVIIYCLRGIRSEIGTKILAKNGFDAYNLEGGLIVWYNEVK